MASLQRGGVVGKTGPKGQRVGTARTRLSRHRPHDGQAEALLDPFGARGFWPRLLSVSRCAAHTIEITIFIGWYVSLATAASRGRSRRDRLVVSLVPALAM